MAGASAAFRLVRAGHDVTILEARDRAGGRVLTVREPFRYGQHAEAGAMFVYNFQSLTVGYLEHFGLELDPIPSDQDHLASYYLEGRRIDDPLSPTAPWPLRITDQEQKLGMRGMYNEYVKPIIDELGDPRGIDWPPEAFRKYDAMSTLDFLTERGASPEAIQLLRKGFLDEWGDGVETTSALYLLRDIDFYKDGSPSHRMPHWLKSGTEPGAKQVCSTVRGGTDRLADAFASCPELSGRIRYDHEVLSIADDGAGGFNVTCSHAGKTVTEHAEHVICTIPFSVLRDIELPKLPPKKVEVIRKLRYTSVVRVFLQFQQRFWGERQYVLTDLPVMGLNNQTITQPGPPGILEAIVTGPFGRMFSSLPPEARLSTTLEQFEMVFPGASDTYLGGASKSWDEDPWARGDWCWYAPGEFLEFWPHIGSRVGNLHFAGEHTSALPGWMQGAFESGHRAAREVGEPAT
jgi:monoamine oxidase